LQLGAGLVSDADDSDIFQAGLRVQLGLDGSADVAVSRAAEASVGGDRNEQLLRGFDGLSVSADLGVLKQIKQTQKIGIKF
jgi:hypothetical protein